MNIGTAAQTAAVLFLLSHDYPAKPPLIAVYRAVMVVKPFSCSGKKRAKRSRPKGRYEQMRPLRYPPPHRQNFNAKLKGRMPLIYYVFALDFGEFVKTTAILVRVSATFPALRREGYIGEGAFCS